MKVLIWIEIRNGIFVIVLEQTETFFTEALHSHTHRHTGPTPGGRPRKPGATGRFDLR